MTRTFLPTLVLFATFCAACGSAERPAPSDSMSIDAHVANASAPDEGTSAPDEGTTDPGAATETSASGGVQDIVASGACEHDTTFIDCKVVLPTMNGTNNCFVGTQVCIDGEWSACMTDADVVEMLELAGD